MLGRAGSPIKLEQHNVRCLTLDTAMQGFIAAGINVFVAVFLVRLGAPNDLIGFLAAAPALGAIFLSLPAGALLEGRRDLVRIVNLSRLGLRGTYLLIALVPFVVGGPAEIWAIVALWTLTSVPAAVANLAWTTVVARIVPPLLRPRVNGNRWALLSVVTAVAGMGFGWLLDRVPQPWNFQTVFVASFVAGLVSIYLFGLIRLPGDPSERATVRSPSLPPIPSPSQLIDGARRYPRFTRFLLAGSVYRVGLNLPVALYPIYAVREVHASNTIIGLQATAGNLALVASYLLWGRLATNSGASGCPAGRHGGPELVPTCDGAGPRGDLADSGDPPLGNLRLGHRRLIFRGLAPHLPGRAAPNVRGDQLDAGQRGHFPRADRRHRAGECDRHPPRLGGRGRAQPARQRPVLRVGGSQGGGSVLRTPRARAPARSIPVKPRI